MIMYVGHSSSEPCRGESDRSPLQIKNVFTDVGGQCFPMFLHLVCTA